MIVIEDILNFTYKLFQTIMVSGQVLWHWFSDTIDAEIAEFFGLSVTTTNIEMVFGSILIMALVMSVIKLAIP